MDAVCGFFQAATAAQNKPAGDALFVAPELPEYKAVRVDVIVETDGQVAIIGPLKVIAEGAG